MTMKISPSILSADFACLAKEVRAVEEHGADYIHVDVMDGRFVPNITIGPFVVEAVKKITKVPLDVHLMIEEPERYVEAFVKAGSDVVTVHAEATKHLNAVLASIRKLGAKAGVSINPATPVCAIEEVLGDVDLVLVMSVNPGFSGQGFIKSSLDKIKRVRKLLDSIGSKAELEVDGGIKTSNIAEVARAGANVFVAGSAIFGSPDYGATMRAMRSELAKS
jgi:ribulose-phosphate 3-epimerase